MKICNICNLEKELSEFNKNTKSKDGYNYWCRSCNKIKRREYNFDGRHTAKTLEIRIRNRNKIRNYLASLNLTCENCEENHPGVLDFHHLDPKLKEKAISRLIADGKLERLKEEIKKCIVLCSNCHRKLHWEERNNKLLGGEIGSLASADIAPSHGAGDNGNK